MAFHPPSLCPLTTADQSRVSDFGFFCDPDPFECSVSDIVGACDTDMECEYGLTEEEVANLMLGESERATRDAQELADDYELNFTHEPKHRELDA